MLLHIVGQRISAASAFTVYDRIIAATGGVPTPSGVLELGLAGLRGCGISTAKATYALNLAEAQAEHRIDIERMDRRSDTEALAALTGVPGIGTWSAETFLIHNLRRPDVLPADDRGLREAVRNRWQLDRLPTVGEVRTRALAWSPYRSYAAALLWRSLRPPGELSDPKARALSAQARPKKHR
jgi:3-methyladenine DNA glycosylase/8-oxoguanine DNA glycosylase